MTFTDAIAMALALGAVVLVCAYRLRRLRIAEFALRATQVVDHGVTPPLHSDARYLLT